MKILYQAGDAVFLRNLEKLAFDRYGLSVEQHSMLQIASRCNTDFIIVDIPDDQSLCTVLICCSKTKRSYSLPSECITPTAYTIRKMFVDLDILF